MDRVTGYCEAWPAIADAGGATASASGPIAGAASASAAGACASSRPRGTSRGAAAPRARPGAADATHRRTNRSTACAGGTTDAGARCTGNAAYRRARCTRDATYRGACCTRDAAYGGSHCPCDTTYGTPNTALRTNVAPAAENGNCGAAAKGGRPIPSHHIHPTTPVSIVAGHLARGRGQAGAWGESSRLALRPICWPQRALKADSCAVGIVLPRILFAIVCKQVEAIGGPSRTPSTVCYWPQFLTRSSPASSLSFSSPLGQSSSPL